uniref:Uncharacterized protein n=1 Tax=Candidatus Methanophaga sp. ANME-1 ERB7 TaxID=2759913 RepID=A0A7G9Z458_9EURY|nr:hypothetical protein FPOEFMDM_00027 [Methanosarcinales archaeon ANME-1 ERB7]QNO55113.1 hypothetical protein MNNOGLJF_00027 [Methanosarcinales archaeon ANME-1 ERB7]
MSKRAIEAYCGRSEIKNENAGPFFRKKVFGSRDGRFKVIK